MKHETRRSANILKEKDLMKFCNIDKKFPDQNRKKTLIFFFCKATFKGRCKI